MKYCLRNILDCPRYLIKRSPLPGNTFKNIVFVCQGNICRSAFAEFYLRDKTKNPSLQVTSCGLNVNRPMPSPDSAVKAGLIFGVDLKSHFSKSCASCDLSIADLILPMEYAQYLQMLEKFPEYKHKIFLLADFLPWPQRAMCNIYDPYGKDENAFIRCFKRIRTALDRLALKCEA
ncbi:MAG: hypothetical protein KKD32_12745 [Proteobacteria bacterium]|nr:hypothetical protein [Pseudomonadota bacterium]MBU2482827.1 hypothetical protein [Pseudomonadota bacterium]